MWGNSKFHRTNSNDQFIGKLSCRDQARVKLESIGTEKLQILWNLIAKMLISGQKVAFFVGFVRFYLTEGDP